MATENTQVVLTQIQGRELMLPTVQHNSDCCDCFVKVAQPCPTLCNPHGLYSPWNSPGQNTGVGSLSLLQGNLPNPGIELRSSARQVDSSPAEPQTRTSPLIIPEEPEHRVYQASLWPGCLCPLPGSCVTLDEWLHLSGPHFPQG